MKRRWKQVLAALAAGVILSGCVSREPERLALPESSLPAEPGLALSEILGALGKEKAAENRQEIRAVWIAYLDLAPLLRDRTEDQFAADFSAMAENCREAGFNTLVVQVRPFGDSFYPSDYFSWSSLAGGALSYDPMAIMTEIAGEKDLSFHAWINPLRAMTEAEAAALPGEYPIGRWYADLKLRAERLILLDGRIYLNPASAEVRKLIADGGAELAANYSIDGLHIDDYFYPPSLDLSMDEAAYAAYCGEGGALSQEDWRRENTFQMVRELSAAVKAAAPWVQFGVSPRGIMDQNYHQLYADLEQWAREPGCLDYLAPQLYYGFSHSSAPFSETAAAWDRLARDWGIPLVAGLAAYKVGLEDPYAGAGEGEWLDPEVLAAQIQEVRGLSAYGGVMLFRYGSIFQPEESCKAAMEEARETFLPLLSEKAAPAGG